MLRFVHGVQVQAVGAQGVYVAAGVGYIDTEYGLNLTAGSASD